MSESLPAASTTALRAEQGCARVLVVDDDARVGTDLRAMLEPRGYTVLAAQGAGEALIRDALESAARFRPHVAVIDLRLFDDYQADRSGLSLLNKLDSARSILYSAYLTADVTSEASRRYGASDWISKDEAPARLIDAVDAAARENCAARRGTMITPAPAGGLSEQVRQSVFNGQSDLPAGIVEDVLCQLFPASAGIRLETLEGSVRTPGPVSRGRSVVVLAFDQRVVPLVVKLARAESCLRESEHYQEHIYRNLRGHFHAIPEGRPVTFWGLGGVLYSFLGAESQSPHTFTEQYLAGQPVVPALRHFFTEVWRELYRRDVRQLHETLFQAYDSALNLSDRLAGFDNGRESLHFDGIPPLPNAVRWVQRHRDHSFVPGAREATTHGDLHGDNLFVDGEHAWAIDFERSGPGPILRDFVELEVDLVTRLIPFPADDLALLFELALILTEPRVPGAELRPTAALAREAQTARALPVLAALRALACEMTGYADMREYLWGLLLDCVFVATLVAGDSPQRERALLFGGVICQRLRHWGGPWPPAGWPPLAQSRVRIQPEPAQLSLLNAKETRLMAMLPVEQQAAITVVSEATKFLFGELGRRLEFWRNRKGDTTPQTVQPAHDPSRPAVRLDDLEQAVNGEALARLGGNIATSMQILRRLTRERDGHRKQLNTDTLLSPKERAWIENRLPEVEALIAVETETLQGLLEQVYAR